MLNFPVYTFFGLIALLSFIGPINLCGQSTKQTEGWAPLQLLSVEQGLPQSFVSDVVLDDEGFIWVGTRDGLARYDGTRFLPFQHQINDPTSPADNVVSKLWKGGRNELWVQYETGDIDRFNTQTGRCWHLTQQPVFEQIRTLPFKLGSPLKVDRHGNLWGILRGEGVFCCDFRQNKLLRYRQATHGLRSDTIKAIAEDKQHRLWFISRSGISLFNPSTHRFENTAFPFPLANQLGYDATIEERMGVLLRRNGEFLFGDRLHLFFFNPDRRTLRSRTLSIAVRSDLRWLAQRPDGSDYIEHGGTVYHYTDQQGLTPVWRYKPSTDNLATGLWCTGMGFDKAGVLWLGGNTLGLLRLDLAAVPLRAHAFQQSFCQDVMQTELNLSLADRFRWPFANETARSESSYHIRSEYDKQGNLWIALGEQVGYYAVPQKQFTMLPAAPSPVKPTFQGGLRGLSIAPDGKVWVVTDQGKPYWYDRQSKHWQAHSRSDFQFPTAVQANNLLADSTNLWVTTVEKGLLRFPLSGQPHQAIQFGSSAGNQSIHSLLDLEQDPTRPHLLWIGSYQGLLCINKKTLRYQRFTTAQGLPNNTIYSVVPDRKGYLWLSTNKGLCRFDPIRHTVLNLKTADGLPGDEFNRFHHLRLPDGRLAFGGIKGWVTFDPALVKSDTSQPVVALTELKINNKSVDQYGIHSPLVAPVNKLSALALPFDQNYLTFGFAALYTPQPDRVMYRYQLLGYDREWTVGSQPTANYTKLPPGQYTLRVNAANAAGRWSPHIKELRLAIQPPLWASGWAYGLYALLAGAALVGFVRFRSKLDRERHERMVRERQADELRQLDQAKTRFFTNVSHELRTPLSLVLGPISSILTSRQLTDRDEHLLQTARRNTQHLLSLVNELLDFTKLEAGKMTLLQQPVQLKPLISRLVANFDSQAHQKGIRLTSDPQIPDELVLALDERKLRQVLTNLLANALKFTPAGGTVHIVVQYIAPHLRVSIADTGRGILPNDLPHVFERYFQTKQADAPIEGGTGIGLALCQELVRLMQGSIRADSQWGKGSTFTVVIPAPVSTITEENGSAIDVAPKFVALVDSPSVPADHSVDNKLQVQENQQVDSVLVVEDNPDLRDYLAMILSPSMTVQTVENGQVALDVLASQPHPPALIISDIMMPVMNGFQLLETLKAHDTYRRIPVIMLTARAELADKLRALRIGVDDYLLKPFDEEELIVRVTTLLQNQRERALFLSPALADDSDENEFSVTSPTISAENNRWLERLEELITAQLDNYNLTADQLADELAMSRRTFYRTIKRLTGLTPTQYLTEARFRQARLLLETRQVSSVKQVANRVGFRQVSHFAQMYQQRFGKQPSDYL
ncbi:hybrid sensor histidine kinase/response regulator transcription factor [Spirosoma agri]|uniref:histidine kinase n=1 Tax=Spirosoma agri TaxID=1987381 RepID=A0A6M0IQW0_9BACT|nr:hybrid sensor histidine kinase/response regulator transcription factor [Spirosoma agri]NEU70686.1 response regulator [Spirosoma agri]